MCVCVCVHVCVSTHTVQAQHISLFVILLRIFILISSSFLVPSCMWMVLVLLFASLLVYSNPEASKIMTDWNLEFDKKLVNVSSRALMPESIFQAAPNKPVCVVGCWMCGWGD